MKQGSGEEVTLEGVLIPVAWGPSGEILSVGLTTFDEDEYRVETSQGEDIRNLLRKHVRITGVAVGRVIRSRTVEVLTDP